MKLQKNSETKEYTKDPEIHTEPLRPKITDLWYQGVDSDSSDSEDEKKKNDEDNQTQLQDIEDEKKMTEEEMERGKYYLISKAL